MVKPEDSGWTCCLCSVRAATQEVMQFHQFKAKGKYKLSIMFPKFAMDGPYKQQALCNYQVFCDEDKKTVT